MFRIQRAVLTLAAMVALAGCEDPFEPDLAPEGETRFSYSGARTGQFEAVGRMNRRNPNAGTWALGELQGTANERILGVFAQQRSGTIISGIALEWRGAHVGTVTCTAETTGCPFLAEVQINYEVTTGRSEGLYRGNVGTVTVTELTEDRAVGTFSITIPERVTAPTPETPKIQASGSFDVALAFDKNN